MSFNRLSYYHSDFIQNERVEVDIDSESEERSKSPKEGDVPLDQGDWFNVDDYIDYNVWSSEADLPDETPVEMPAETPFAKASRLVNKV